MRRILMVLAFSMMLCFVVTPASAASLGVVGVANNTGLSDGKTPFSANGMGLGGGLLAGIGIAPMTELELGAFFMHRKIMHDFTTLGVTMKIDASGYMIPLLVRFWLVNFFSVAAGPYLVHYSAFSVVDSLDSNPAVSVSDSSPISASDIGATVSMQLRVPVAATMGIIVDGRFNYGFKTFHTSEEQLLLGLGFKF